MKALFFIFFLFIAIQSNASVLGRGVSESGTGKVFDRILAPEFQVTQYGDKDGLLETGNSNLLKNPSLESYVLLQNWTGAGGVTPALNTSNVAGGKRAATISFTSLNGVIVHQDVTPTIKMQGRNWEYGAWVSTTTANIQVCAREGGVKVDPCQNVISDGVGRFYPILRAGPASGSVGVEIRTSASTTGSIVFDDGYLGLPRNLGSGVPPNTFTASVSATGTISNETPGDWLSGTTCPITSTSIFTCTHNSTIFSSTPNCVVSMNSSNSNNQTITLLGSSSSSQSIVYTTSSSSSFALPFTISCTKTGSDFIQPAITPAQWDYDWKDYSQAIVPESGTFPTYTLNLMQQARFAGKLYLKGKLTMTGTNTWGEIRIPVPTGLQILTSVIAPGEINYFDAGTNFYMGSIISMNASYIRIGSKSGTNGQGLIVTQTSPFTWASGDTVEWFIGPIDVVGWTTSSAAPQLVGSVIADTSIKAEKSAGVTSVDYGTYTPTGTAVTNVSAITPSITSYVRIGPIVFVSGVVSVDPTAGNAVLSWRLSLPVPSNFTDTTDASGTFGSNGSGSDIGANVNQIRADAANDQVLFSATLTSALHGVVGIPFQFMYRVL